MPDWTKAMEQSYEYYIVDPGTWKDSKMLTTVKPGSSVSRDSDVESLGSATINITEPIGECYIRIYLVTIQNGVKERHPLGTFLVQTPSISFDGKINDVTMDAYTPLLELKEKLPPIGYSLLKGDNIMEKAYLITRENTRAPVVKPTCDKTLYDDSFVAGISETWLAYNIALMSKASYSYDLDPMGRILFAPHQDTASLQPVWTYDDGNSSILYPELTTDHDLYGIPNVVEVVYSKKGENLYARVVNDDPNSPTSTVNRGREILYRETAPKDIGNPTQRQLDAYAKQVLRDMSTVEYKISYTHGYCPVRVGDCVRLNYKKAGLTNVKGRVISQSIKCEPGCPVKEKATFTAKLWR